MCQGTAEKQCCWQPRAPGWVARVGAVGAQGPLHSSFGVGRVKERPWQINASAGLPLASFGAVEGVRVGPGCGVRGGGGAWTGSGSAVRVVAGLSN
jgi:hypothetical protein